MTAWTEDQASPITVKYHGCFGTDCDGGIRDLTHAIRVDVYSYSFGTLYIKSNYYVRPYLTSLKLIDLSLGDRCENDQEFTSLHRKFHFVLRPNRARLWF